MDAYLNKAYFDLVKNQTKNISTQEIRKIESNLLSNSNQSQDKKKKIEEPKAVTPPTTTIKFDDTSKRVLDAINNSNAKSDKQEGYKPINLVFDKNTKSPFRSKTAYKIRNIIIKEINACLCGMKEFLLQSIRAYKNNNETPEKMVVELTFEQYEKVILKTAFEIREAKLYAIGLGVLLRCAMSGNDSGEFCAGLESTLMRVDKETVTSALKRSTSFVLHCLLDANVLATSKLLYFEKTKGFSNIDEVVFYINPDSNLENIELSCPTDKSFWSGTNRDYSGCVLGFHHQKASYFNLMENPQVRKELLRPLVSSTNTVAHQQQYPSPTSTTIHKTAPSSSSPPQHSSSSSHIKRTQKKQTPDCYGPHAVVTQSPRKKTTRYTNRATESPLLVLRIPNNNKNDAPHSSDKQPNQALSASLVSSTSTLVDAVENLIIDDKISPFKMIEEEEFPGNLLGAAEQVSVFDENPQNNPRYFPSVDSPETISKDNINELFGQNILRSKNSDNKNIHEVTVAKRMEMFKRCGFLESIFINDCLLPSIPSAQLDEEEDDIVRKWKVDEEEEDYYVEEILKEVAQLTPFGGLLSNEKDSTTNNVYYGLFITPTLMPYCIDQVHNFLQYDEAVAAKAEAYCMLMHLPKNFRTEPVHCKKDFKEMVVVHPLHCFFMEFYMLFRKAIFQYKEVVYPKNGGKRQSTKHPLDLFYVDAGNIPNMKSAYCEFVNSFLNFFNSSSSKTREDSIFFDDWKYRLELVNLLGTATYYLYCYYLFLYMFVSAL